jgi:hypothetical protein
MTITDNCVVSLEYELTDAQNQTQVLDSNRGADPLEFIVGKGQNIPILWLPCPGKIKPSLLINDPLNLVFFF